MFSQTTYFNFSKLITKYYMEKLIVLLIITDSALKRKKNTNVKDYHYHDFPNTEFSFIFLTIDTRQFEVPNYLLKIGGYRPLKGRCDIICNDIIFH